VSDDHLLLVKFPPGGGVVFYPMTEDPEGLAKRLQELAAHLVENPTQTRCAAGDHAQCER
jgi:hypothetical protein